jgi:NarL family two-component system sensor histidine kinase LiaS
MLQAYQQWKNEVRRPFFFHRLQWKLARAYVLVTVALVATLQIGVYLLVMSMLMRAFRAPDFPPHVATAMLAAAPQFAPHLKTQGQLLLEQFRFTADFQLKLTGERLSFGYNFQGRDDGRDFLDERIRALWLTDTSGKVLAAYGASLPVGADLATQLPAAAERLQIAREGVTEVQQLVSKNANDFLLAAVPIFDASNQQVVGVFWAEVNIALGWDLARGFVSELFGQLVWVPIFGLVFGLAFGFITARNLTHRLNTIAHAASQWAQGRFNERAPEKPNDELGALGARLNQMAAELQKQMALQQQLATLEERNRLALELHDTVKQELFACAMQISAAQRLLTAHPEAAQRHLQESETLAKHMQDELAAIIQELLPVEKQARTLTQRLQQMTADWTRQTGIPVTLQLNANGHHYSPTIERTLLRIAQEAFANIARHSAATAAALYFEHTPADAARLTISDNGQGFERAATSDGVGLQSMRERAASLPDGAFTLETDLQQGTRIVVHFKTS